MKNYFVLVLTISFSSWGMEQIIGSELHGVVELNEIDLVEQLIKAGTDLNIKDTKGDAPLHYALRSKYDTITLLFIAAGAHLKQKDKCGECAAQSIIKDYEFLVESKRKSYLCLFKALLLAGIRLIDIYHMRTIKSVPPHLFSGVTIPYKTYNPLSLLNKIDIERIIVENNLQEFSTWLERTKSINKQDELGATILMYAAAQNQVEMVKLLLAKGAYPFLKDNYGRTVFDIVKMIRNNKDDLELTPQEQAGYELILKLCYKKLLKHLLLMHNRKTVFLNALPTDMIKVTMLFLTGCVYSDVCKMT